MKQAQVLLEACSANKVQRLVLTAALSNVTEQYPDTPTNEDGAFDESTWAREELLDVLDPLQRAKFNQEKVLHEYMQSHERDVEVVTLLPGFIVGPTLLGYVKEKHPCGFVKSMITGQMRGLPRIQVHAVDVRDVAKAHLNAVEIPEAADQRFILSAESVWFKTMAQHLQTEFKPQGVTVHTKEISYCGIRTL